MINRKKQTNYSEVSYTLIGSADRNRQRSIVEYGVQGVGAFSSGATNTGVFIGACERHKKNLEYRRISAELIKSARQADFVEK